MKSQGKNHFTRREFIGMGTTAFAAATMSNLLPGCASNLPRPTADAKGVGYFAPFGVSERMLSDAINTALSKGGDWADLFFQHRVNRYLGLEDGEVNRAYITVELGLGVRVIKKDQTGYAYTEDLSLNSVLQAAKTAASVADGPARPFHRSFRACNTAQYYPSKINWESVEPPEKLRILTEINSRALQSDSRIKKVNISFSDVVDAKMIVDSQGRIIEDIQPMTELRIGCVAENHGRRESNSYSCSGRAGFEYYSPERIKKVLDLAISRTLILFDAIQPSAGEMPVVLAAGSSGILLHEAIGHGMEADHIRKNISIYGGKIGKPIAKQFVNIVDDGTLLGARGSINVDDEGNNGQKTMLVENGILTTYLHDVISARHYKVNPTGNGRRESYAFAPLPRMRSTYMLPGPHKKEEIIASIKKGIYCEDIINGQVNIGAGDFSFYTKNGFLIENGKLTRPIKDVNLIGNGPKVLEKMDMVADDLVIADSSRTCGKNGQRVPVSVGLPTVRIPLITVGGRPG